MHQLQKGGRAKVETSRADASRRDSKSGRAASGRVLLGITLIVTLAIDQVTKAWALATLTAGTHIALAGDVFQLRLVRNSGSAFGLFSGFPLVIFLVNIAIMAVVAVWALRTTGPGMAFGLVLGGGLGNLADRIFRSPGMGLGEVVDFIYLSFWPTFNLADSAIVLGVGLLLLDGLREPRT